MKTLLLVRHAHTASAGLHEKDIERHLTPKGQSDAMMLGHALLLRLMVPNLVLCSTAERTQETYRYAKKVFPKEVTTHFLPAIYEASCGELFHLVQKTRDTLNTVMLIGHNPAIQDLCLLFRHNAPEEIKSKLILGYPPGTLSVIRFSCTHWHDITPENGTLTEFLTPQDYAQGGPRIR